MQPKKRKMQIRQGQLRRRKNLSSKQVSLKEKKLISGQERKAISTSWKSVKEPLDTDSLRDVEAWHNIKFKPVFQKLSKQFPEKLEILDEGAGRSSLKNELLKSGFGKKLNVITTDVRRGTGCPDKEVKKK